MLATAFVCLAARCWVSCHGNLKRVYIIELVDTLASRWATRWWWRDVKVLPQTTVSQQVADRLWQNHGRRLLQWLINTIPWHTYTLTVILTSWLSLNASGYSSIVPVHSSISITSHMWKVAYLYILLLLKRQCQWRSWGSWRADKSPRPHWADLQYI